MHGIITQRQRQQKQEQQRRQEKGDNSMTERRNSSSRTTTMTYFASRTTTQALLQQRQRLYIATFCFVLAFLLLILRPLSNPLLEQQVLLDSSGNNSGVDDDDHDNLRKQHKNNDNTHLETNLSNDTIIEISSTAEPSVQQPEQTTEQPQPEPEPEQTTEQPEPEQPEQTTEQPEPEQQEPEQVLSEQQPKDVVIVAQEQQPHLRFNWSNLELKSDLAKQLHENQHNCSNPIVLDEWRISPLHQINYGLGSDLHVYGTHLINALEQQQRLRSYSSKSSKTTDAWAWLDKDSCKEQYETGIGSLSCYLNIEPKCNHEKEEEEIVEKKRSKYSLCLSGAFGGITDKKQIAQHRASITEFMFSSVSQVVIDEAKRQLIMAFPPHGIVPTNLICVHIRWGDKHKEMKLVEMKLYIQAIERIIQEANLNEVHILLCSEDPDAIETFEKQMPSKSWNIYLDPFFTLYEPYRKNRNVTYSITTQISMETNGKPGLWAMASLLVAMEANYFVLTTKSNWSRLYNELRKSVIDPRCNNCTKMIDLRSGEC